MPPLDVEQNTIYSAAASPTAPPIRPSPARTGPLRLERLSPKEFAWLGHRFGLDTVYYVTPLGWGEDAPLYGYDLLEGVTDVEGNPVVYINNEVVVTGQGEGEQPGPPIPEAGEGFSGL